MLLCKRQLLYEGLGDRGIFIYILSVSITAYHNLVTFAAAFRDVTQRSPYETEFRQFSKLKKHSGTWLHQDYTPGEGNNFELNNSRKKNVIKETTICERKVSSIRATFHLSQLASALKRDLCL